MRNSKSSTERSLQRPSGGFTRVWKTAYVWSHSPRTIGGFNQRQGEASPNIFDCPDLSLVFKRAKLGQFILRKIIEIVTTWCQILRLKRHQIRFRLGPLPQTPLGEPPQIYIPKSAYAPNTTFSAAKIRLRVAQKRIRLLTKCKMNGCRQTVRRSETSFRSFTDCMTHRHCLLVDAIFCYLLFMMVTANLHGVICQ